MALGSIYASQAGRKVMDRDARDLAVASSSGGSKVRRYQQALEVAARYGLDASASSGGGSKL